MGKAREINGQAPRSAPSLVAARASLVLAIREWPESTSQRLDNALNHTATGSKSQTQHSEYACSDLQREFAWQVQGHVFAKACLNHCASALRFNLAQSIRRQKQARDVWEKA